MIAAALNAFGSTQQKVFQQDRSQTVGASEVGKCARQVFYLKNEGDAVYGAPRDAGAIQRWGATMRGTVIEDALWEPALRAAYGDRLLYAGKGQRTLVSGFLSATPDGLLTEASTDILAPLGVEDIQGDCLTLECKSADPRTNLTEPKPENVFQVHTQIGLIRDLTPHKPAFGLLSYIDASFWDVVHEFPIQFDPAVYAEAKARASDIMLATSAASLKPEGVISGCRECDLCAFTQACGAARAERVPPKEKPVPVSLAASIVELAREARSARDLSAASLLSAKSLEEEVRALLGAADTRKLSYDNVSVSWSSAKSGDGDRLTIKVLAPAPAVEPAPIETAGSAVSIMAA